MPPLQIVGQSSFFCLLALYIFSLNKNSKWSNAQFDTAQKNSKGIHHSYFEHVLLEIS